MRNSIPYSIKLLKRSSFRKKIKELLLNFVRSEDEYVEVSRLIKLFNTLGEPIFVMLVYLLCFMLVYSSYCIIVSLLSFSPSIKTCKMCSVDFPASISL